VKSINPRSALAFFHDVVAAGVAWAAAFWLRFNFDIPPGFGSALWLTIGWVMALDALCFWRFGLYRGLWRYASLHDLRLIVIAVGVAAMAFPALLVLIKPAFVVPRSVFVLHPLLLLLLMGGSRLLYRAWKERNIGRLGALDGNPVVILGAGDAAVTLLKDLAWTTTTGLIAARSWASPCWDVSPTCRRWRRGLAWSTRSSPCLRLRTASGAEW
jgi:FlaA1/EpsC-like NDP-sugar epimerase